MRNVSLCSSILDYDQNTWGETRRSEGNIAALRVVFPGVVRFRGFKFTLGPGLLESAHALKREGQVGDCGEDGWERDCLLRCCPSRVQNKIHALRSKWVILSQIVNST